MLSIKRSRPAASPESATTAGGPTNTASDMEGKAEHRSAQRLPASAVPSITGLRIPAHGGEATLINISASGLLAECGERLQLGYRVTVLVEGTFAPRLIRGKVARSSVATLGSNGLLRYHVGIAFDAPIALNHPVAAESAPDPVAPEPSEPPPPIPTPARPVIRNRW